MKVKVNAECMLTVLPGSIVEITPFQFEVAKHYLEVVEETNEVEEVVEETNEVEETDVEKPVKKSTKKSTKNK